MPARPTARPTVRPTARRLAGAAGSTMLALTLAPAITWPGGANVAVPLVSAGALSNGAVLVAVRPAEAAGATYLEGSAVLRLPGGRLRYLPAGAGVPVTVAPDDRGAAASVAAWRAWLAAGTIPGATPQRRRLAVDSLVFLRLLHDPGGGELAAPVSAWRYVWPRDASFAAAAFAATGHAREATQILAFLARTQTADGTWPARARPDGRPVGDGRPPQLDATGWVCWSAWLLVRLGGGREQAEALWPTVRGAAGAAARSLGPDGVPRPSPDYWEQQALPTLGTAAALAAGLRAAADLAGLLGHAADQARFRQAAARLARGLERFRRGDGELSRTPAGGGPDAAVAWLAPPFGPPDPAVRAAVVAAARRLAVPGGGLVPGRPWANGDAWTPATAAFALAAAAGGDRAEADRRLDWLAAHRTGLGALPERVGRSSEPRSVAPLAWTHAMVLLALVAAQRGLPVPP